MSNEVSALTYPAVPVAAATVQGSEAASLTWSATNGAASYKIWYSPTPGAETLYAAGVTGTTATIHGLKTGMAHYFKVSAVNASAESAMSTEVSAGLDPPRKSYWSTQVVVWTLNLLIPPPGSASRQAFLSCIPAIPLTTVAIDPGLKAVYVANNQDYVNRFVDSYGIFWAWDLSALQFELRFGNPSMLQLEGHQEGSKAEHLLVVTTPGGK